MYRQLGRLQHLQELRIGGTALDLKLFELGRADLESLKKLQVLNVLYRSNSFVTKEIIWLASRFQSLEKLELDKKSVDAKLVEDLKDINPQLDIQLLPRPNVRELFRHLGPAAGAGTMSDWSDETSDDDSWIDQHHATDTESESGNSHLSQSIHVIDDDEVLHLEQSDNGDDSDDSYGNHDNYDEDEIHGSDDGDEAGYMFDRLGFGIATVFTPENYYSDEYDNQGSESSGLEGSGLEGSGLEDSGLEDSGLEDSGLEGSGLEDSGLEGSDAMNHDYDTSDGYDQSDDNEAYEKHEDYDEYSDESGGYDSDKALEVDNSLGSDYDSDGRSYSWIGCHTYFSDSNSERSINDGEMDSGSDRPVDSDVYDQDDSEVSIEEDYDDGDSSD
ncbi:hypothetical protein BGZ65_006738 [Modicella reniformis]|uniref:Uncharacterized protein n=1 Tax=Modicella reniformis TaxID=1440133 RepID=A0A9P6M7U8_9FUNG|nr:hypothetical protein BGZ65_006738 [Modicella reniformis]